MSYLIDIITKEGEPNAYLPDFPLQISVPYRLGKDLPVQCRCGFLLKANYKLTDLYCPNPFCFESNAYKVIKVFEKAHVSLDMGVKTVERIILHNKFSRHMDIFTIEDKSGFPDTHSDAVKSKWLEGLKLMRKNISLGDYIEYFQLNNIGGTKCSYIFSGMNTVAELEQAINNNVEFRIHISKVLGFASSNSSSTWGVYHTLKRYLPLLKKYEPYFEFNHVEGTTLFLSLTGGFTHFRPRTSLIGWLADNYKINPILVKYSMKSDLLVYEEINHSRQFDSAVRDGKAVHLSDFLKKIEHLRRDKADE